MSSGDITFSFGENWCDYSQGITPDTVSRAAADLEYWLGKGCVSGRTILDIGSGSGIHSLAFQQLGARSVRSFDYDQKSVEATLALWDSCGRPATWVVSHGSILDRRFIASLGPPFDIVYSWGVLHHTGDMWKALENATHLVAPGGIMWVTLYSAGPRYMKHLAVKRRYNAASNLGKKMMVYTRIAHLILSRVRDGKNPLAWNEKKGRGMTVYHDLIDWLGGLPYEVADEDDVVRIFTKLGFVVERIKVRGEGRCNVFVFRRLHGAVG